MSDVSQPSAAGFELAVEAAGHAIWMTDRDGTITYVNPAFEDITGYDAEEAIGQKASILNSGVHPDEHFERLWETILAGDVWEEEVVNRTKDGELYTAHQTIAPITKNGEIDGFVAIQTDITEKKQQEKRLRQYERAIEGGHDLICATDRNEEYLFANSKYCSFHGIDSDEVTELTLEDVFDGEEYRLVRRNVDRVFQGETVRYRMTRTNPTQGERTFDIRYYPLEDGDEGVSGVVATMHDISDLVKRTEELQRNRELLTQTEQLADVGGWELDLETETLQWTHGTRQLHDVSADFNPSSGDWIEFYHPEDREKVEQAVKHCREQGNPFDIKARLVTVEGRTRWVRTAGEHGKRDENPVLRGAIRDITDQKNREQQLMVMNRVLRHNLRNDLNIVQGYAELLEGELVGLEEHDIFGEKHASLDIIEHVKDVSDLSSSIKSELGKIERQADQIASFPFETVLTGAQKIQEYADGLMEIAEKAQAIELNVDKVDIAEPVAIRPVVEEIAARYRERFPDASVEIISENVSVLGNRKAIRRIVSELVENALQHSDRDSPTATIRVQKSDAECVTLQVEDFGPGIPEMERQTLAEGEETSLMHGSGIGLWIVHWLVTQLSGTLTIEENDPRGSIVKIEFPSVDDS